MEFLIKRTDGDWFDLHIDKFNEVLRPNSFFSHPVDGWGDHRIEVEGIQISFSFEDPGFLISFESGDIEVSKALKIVEEICENITKATNQVGEVIAL